MEPSTLQNHLLNPFPHPSFGLITTEKYFPLPLHVLDHNPDYAFLSHTNIHTTHFHPGIHPSFDTVLYTPPGY